MSGNALADSHAKRIATGLPVVDGMLSNPTRCGLMFPEEALARMLSGASMARYEPTARGLPLAREAVATYYAERGSAWAWVQPDRLLLTASTSEAYGLLFKLFGDMGHEILFPLPGYPLVEHLAVFEGLVPVAYPIRYDEAEPYWRIDFDYMEGLVSERTCALVFVAPNNPTGAGLHREDAAQLQAFAGKHGLPLIVDEVFYDYANVGEAYPAPSGECLTFVLNGLSKVVALPQLKLGWITVHGPLQQVAVALERLEYLNDYYLSASTPVQAMVPELLRLRHPLQRRIRDRVGVNYEHLRAGLVHSSFIVLPYFGGWTALLRHRNKADTDALCLELLEQTGVLLHPGSFYGFRGEGWLVVSILPEDMSPIIRALQAIS